MPTTLGPLGLLPKQRINKGTLKKLVFLENFDLEREKQKAIENEVVIPNGSDLVVREFRRFFALNLLNAKPKYSFVPCHKVDYIWHELIVSTRRYETLCNAVYGQFIHHDPQDPRSEYIAENAGEIYGYTLEQLADSFGGIPPKIWGYGASGSAAVCPRCNFGACRTPEV